MQSRLLQDAEQKTWAVVLDTDDDVVPCLLAFARDNALAASHFTAIGAISSKHASGRRWKS